MMLPAVNRKRFVAELNGNLAVCDRRRDRVYYLAGLAVSMLCLAWMMHRENRRGRAR
jgi:hypothetical protein